MCSGDSTANKIAFAISSACNAAIFFVFSTNPFSDSSVMVLLSSVSTTPGSIAVTRMLERTLNSSRKPSLKAVTACFVAQ